MYSALAGACTKDYRNKDKKWQFDFKYIACWIEEKRRQKIKNAVSKLLDNKKLLVCRH